MIIRVGLNSGPAIAALIERSRFIYDAWSETVHLASRIGALLSQQLSKALPKLGSSP